MSFLLPFILFPVTQDLFFSNFLARICGWKSYLTFVCGYKWVFGLLQAGRSTSYPAIIETPVKVIHMLWFKLSISAKFFKLVQFLFSFVMTVFITIIWNNGK